MTDQRPQTDSKRNVKRIILGIASTIGVAVIGFLVNQYGPDTVHGIDKGVSWVVHGGSSSPVRACDDPVCIDSVKLQWDVTHGDTVVFPKPLQISNSELSKISSYFQSIQGPRAFYRWAHAHGAVDPNSVFVQLVVTGNRNHEVRITSMQASGRCGPPLTGTMMFSQSAGGEYSIPIGFDLDKPDPNARLYYPMSGRFGGDYFATQTVSLKPHEQQTFEIVGISTHHYCRFSIKLTVLDGNRSVVETVQNGHQPFEVSGTLPLRQYQSVYLGGISKCRAGPYWIRESSCQST
jgi:hypothetical protein